MVRVEFEDYVSVINKIYKLTPHQTKWLLNTIINIKNKYG